MNEQKLTSIFLLLIPFICFGQTFPIDVFGDMGLSQEEIVQSKALKGVNGIGGYYLLLRREQLGEHPVLKLHINNFELYTPEGKLQRLTDYTSKQSNIIYFEFMEDELFMIEKIFDFKRTIKISKFDLTSSNCIYSINGEIACEFANDCDWIRYDEKKLAFFTNTFFNEGLEYSTVYEFDWQTNKSSMIQKVLDSSIDAGTGRNFDLRDVKFNSISHKFDYSF